MNECRLNNEQYAQYQLQGIIRLMLPSAQGGLLEGFLISSNRGERLGFNF